MRGRQAFLIDVGDDLGLIPAGAGQTTRQCARHPAHRAHPRGCGADRKNIGSRVRLKGLIPAGAGQTVLQVHLRLPCGAHPRGCGADVCASSRHLWRPGSSPRVRGRRKFHVAQAGGDGLIPAGAGQTQDELALTSAKTAHPRGCGADLRGRCRPMPGRGSSPRVRGRPDPVCDGWSGVGLIPAGAGQTHRAG